MSAVANMRAFIRVVEAGSFSSAARQLGIAPSSVSRQINELENILGVRLFQRTTRKLSLTEAGDLYFHRASDIINDIDEAALAVSQLDGLPSGILRLTVPASLSRRHIVPALFDFQQIYSSIQVVLTVSDQLVDLIDNRIDLAIRIGRLKDSSFVARKIASSRRVLCASPSYINNAEVLELPEQLINHNCITFRSHPGNNMWKFQGMGKTTEIHISGNLFIDDGESLVAAAVEGYGVILVPEWLVDRELKSEHLQEILPNFRAIPSETPIYAIYPRQHHLPPKVRAFVDFMVNRYSKKELKS
jgi:DNA-binding transcriptional LysR family regulator